MAASHETSLELRVRTRQRLLLLGVLLLVLYVVVPQFVGLSSAWTALRSADWWYVGIGAALTALTYFAAAGIYVLLARYPLRYDHTLLVQVSSAFANRLLPAGLGGISLNVAYLRKARHSFDKAATVVGTNNALGLLGHALLLGIAVSATDVAWTQLRIPSVATPALVGGVLAAALAFNLLIFRRFRQLFLRITAALIKDILSYRTHPLRLIAALACSLLLTCLYTGILWCCAIALDVSLSVGQVLVVFTAGALVGTATPTPGGLLGAEAGLAAGLAAYGVPGSTALAVALLYRLMTYWVPLLPGFAAFLVVRRQLRLFW